MPNKRFGNPLAPEDEPFDEVIKITLVAVLEIDPVAGIVVVDMISVEALDHRDYVIQVCYARGCSVSGKLPRNLAVRISHVALEPVSIGPVIF